MKIERRTALGWIAASGGAVALGVRGEALPRVCRHVARREGERYEIEVGETLVGETLVVLDPTGYQMLTLVDGTRTPFELAEAVALLFDLPPARATEETEGFLSLLQRTGLLEPGRRRT